MGVNFERQLFILAVLAILFTFLGINFSPDLGYIYLGMTLGAAIVVMLAFVKKGSNDGYPIFKGKPQWGNVLLGGAIGFIIFYFAVQLVIPQFYSVAAQAAPLDLATDWAQATALEQSDIVKTIAFGLLIPIIETMLLFGAMTYLYGLFSNINIYDDNLFSFKVVILIAIVMAIFTVFHLTAKGLTNSKDLATSAIFAVVTMGLMIKTQELAPAMVMHVINNTIAITR